MMNYEITRLNLENEMDVIVAHKRSIRVGALLNLSISSQTTFTTAISECCREVIEITRGGLLIFRVTNEDDKYCLAALIRYKDAEGGNHASRETGLDYAKKLVSQFNISFEDGLSIIELKINIPRAGYPSVEKIAQMIDYFTNEYPSSPYERVKKEKEELNRLASEQEEQLIRSRYINEKKTEFLSIASHELKTPLTTIKAFAQLAMADGEACSENVKMYLSKINTQSDKLYKLIQQLLDVSKVESGQLDFSMEAVGMNNYLQDIVTLIGKSIPTHKILIELKEDVVASIDKLRMEQVLSNILINSAKYSNAHSLIRVTTTLLAENMLVISVCDEGIGISEDGLQKVFEKFFRVEEIARSYSGLGMGLYIASKIITGHGGKIWAESQLGKGSTFHFSLPFLFKAAQ